MEPATFTSMGEKLSKDKSRGDAISFDDICPSRTWIRSACQKVSNTDCHSLRDGSLQGGGKLASWLFRSDLEGFASTTASNLFGQINNPGIQELVKGVSEGTQKMMAKLSKGSGPDTGAKILDQMLANQAHRSSVRI